MASPESVNTNKVRTRGGSKPATPGLPGTGESMRAILNRGYEPASCKPYESESSKVRKQAMPMHSRSPEGEKY
jgi:hypothetical protein